MEKLILHLGVHKTATTHLQSRLWNTRGELKRQGILYIDLDSTREFFTSAIRQNEELVPEAKSLLDWKETVLISDENIIGGVGKPKGRNIYGQAKQRLESFLSLTNPPKLDVHITIRNPEDYLVSRYCESLRHFQHMSSAEYFDEIFLREFSWVPFIESVKKVSGTKVSVIDFDSLIADDSAYLKSLTGKNVEFEEASIGYETRRAKITNEVYAVIKELQAHYPAHLVKRILNILERAPQKGAPTPIRPFSKSLSEQLKKNYEKDKQTLLAQTDNE